MVMKIFLRLLICLLLFSGTTASAALRLIPGTDAKMDFPTGYQILQPNAATQKELDALATFRTKLPAFVQDPDPDLEAFNPSTLTEIRVYSAVNSYSLDIFDLRLHPNLLDNNSYINSFKGIMQERFNVTIGDTISSYTTQPALYAVADGTYGTDCCTCIYATIRDQTLILFCGSGHINQKEQVRNDVKAAVDQMHYLLPDPTEKDLHPQTQLSPLAQKAAYAGIFVLAVIFIGFLYHEYRHRKS